MTATRPPSHFLDRVGLRPDPELQRLGRGAQRADRRVRISRRRSKGLARSNLVQQGGELAYLIRHDPEFRGVRREHLVETGPARAAAQPHPALVELLERGIDGHRFSFFVISAAPQEVIQSALDGHRAARPHLRHRARVRAGHRRGALDRRVPAGYGKVAVVEELESRLGIAPDRTIYVGDGSSDVHVMLHVNNRDGFTIAVSENRQLARIAQEHRAQRQRVLDHGADARARAAAGAPARSGRCSRRTACRCTSGRRRGPIASRCARRPLRATEAVA